MSPNTLASLAAEMHKRTARFVAASLSARKAPAPPAPAPTRADTLAEARKVRADRRAAQAASKATDDDALYAKAWGNPVPGKATTPTKAATPAGAGASDPLTDALYAKAWPNPPAPGEFATSD